ncbi:MAG: CDP-glycerol glycerophosphotransferase family protein, partial [Acutalibacteraceae bacterium]
LADNETMDFCHCKLKLIKGESSLDCKPNALLFFDRYKKPNTATPYHQFAWMSGDKLFRVKALRNKGFRFKDDPPHDGRKVFRKLSFLPVGNAFVITPMTERDVVNHARTLRVKWFWKLRYRREQLKTPAGKKALNAGKAKFKQRIAWFVKRNIIRFTPVRQKVLFASVRGNTLKENALAVYEAYPGKKAVFAKPYPHSRKDKLRLFWHFFSSKVIVTDDYFRYFRYFQLKKKQKVIQIWHACGAFKKFGLDYPAADIQTELKTHCQYDTVVVSAEGVREKYARAFGIGVDRVRALGVPRTDKLLDPAFIEAEKRAFFAAHPAFAGKKILLYAPTFREEGMQGKRVRLNPKLDWAALSRELGEDTVLIVKNHPVMKYDLLGGDKFSNIVNMPGENTSRLMIVCDVMITDYSSVIFEAALLNKPTVFYCPDFTSYERDFYLRFPEDLYGELTTDQAGLLAAVRAALDTPRADRLEEFKQTYMGACDGHSTQRVVELIRQKLKEK